MDDVLASLRRLGMMPLDLTTHLDADVRIEIAAVLDALEDAVRHDSQAHAGMERLRRVIEKLAPTPSQHQNNLCGPYCL